MTKRKNILLITSDQQRWDTIGAYSDIIKTPNIDRLSAEGITFDKAYTTNPTCTPARCTILTGHYASRHGCNSIGTSLPEDYPTVPALMSDHGYHTALLGKAHFNSCLSKESFEAAPKIFDMDFFKNWNGPFYGFDYTQLVIGHSVEGHAKGMHYGLWLREQGVDVDKYFGNWNYPDYGVWELPEEVHNSKWTADITLDRMKVAVEEDEPFFIWSSFQDPHNPCFVPEPWASMYADVDVPVYELKEGEMNGKPEIYQNKIDTNAFAGPEVFGRQNWHPTNTSTSIKMDRNRTEEIMRLYYGMISLMDHHIGRIIDGLEELGILDDTIIVFTSDHGDYMGNHGLWWKGLPAYDDALRVPFVVRHPDCRTPGRQSQSMQSLVDLPATFLEVAGIELPVFQQGRIQSEAWIDAEASCRDWALVESRPTDSPFMQKVFYYGNWKLVVYTNEEYGELYNMDTDPEQYDNLYDDPDYVELRLKLLRKFVTAEMEKEGVRRPRIAVA